MLSVFIHDTPLPCYVNGVLSNHVLQSTMTHKGCSKVEMARAKKRLVKAM